MTERPVPHHPAPHRAAAATRSPSGTVRIPPATPFTPVAGATVTLRPRTGPARTTTTAGNGSFSFANLATGTYGLRVSGLCVEQAEQFVDGDEIVTVDTQRQHDAFGYRCQRSDAPT